MSYASICCTALCDHEATFVANVASAAAAANSDTNDFYFSKLDKVNDCECDSAGDRQRSTGDGKGSRTGDEGVVNAVNCMRVKGHAIGHGCS